MIMFSTISTKMYTSWKLLYPPVGLPWTSITDFHPKIMFLMSEHKHIQPMLYQNNDPLNQNLQILGEKTSSPDQTHSVMTLALSLRKQRAGGGGYFAMQGDKPCFLFVFMSGRSNWKSDVSCKFWLIEYGFVFLFKILMRGAHDNCT